MQALNFTPKLLRQRRFLSFLLPLFAIFVGLGSANKAYAQASGASTATIRNVLITAGTSSSSLNTSSYNAIPNTGGTGIGGGIFANTNFGTLDVGTARLLLQGGTVEITEVNGEVFNRAYINFGVATGSINGVAGATTTSPNPPLNQTVELMETNYDASTGKRTFSLTTAARNILALATNTNGGAGQSYRFDVSVNATGQRDDGSGGFEDIAVSGGNDIRRRSVFNATGTPATASIAANTILIAADGTNGSNYYFPNTGTNPQFPGAVFTSSTNAGGVSGAFDVNNGQLRLNNTSVTTTETGANTITSVVLYYRTRLTTDGGGAFQPITLSQSGPTSNGTRNFVIDPASTLNTNSQPNLIATPAVTAAGNYTVDIYYQANGFNSSTGNFNITYPPTGYFSASFTVAGIPIATTIWTGAFNDNWFDKQNWSNGVPNATTNALVRDLGAGNSVPYPNINSDAIKYSAANAILYNNIGSGPARVLNLTLGGTSQASRSITRLEQGQLQVFGDFNNNYDSFIQRENTIMNFAGSPPAPQDPKQVYYNAITQTISGGSFVRVDISGGGKKQLVGVMNISESLNFLTPSVTAVNPVTPNPYSPLNADAGILATDITTPTSAVVVLADRGTINGNNGAQINGETDVSFLYGFIRTSRASVGINDPRTFGNIGMELTFDAPNAPGNIDVTRNTVESYTPLNSKYSIRRIFGIRPGDPATTSGGLSATMVFHYRDSETQQLNGVDLDPKTGFRSTIIPGSNSIPEPNLTIFASSNSGNTFQLIGRDAIDTQNNTVTKSRVRTFATITLGDRENPLPVSLTAFDAKRIGANALITWQTASEQNNKGFNVQVSTDGKTYRTIAFVASETPNSTAPLAYSFTDTENNKAGARYYRLEQLDTNGKSTFFAPKVLTFDGSFVDSASNIIAYPNPLNNETLRLSLNSTVSGTAVVRVLDMTGRQVAQRNLPITIGNNTVPMENMSELKSGLYILNVMLPSGEKTTMKVTKQ